MDPKAKNFPETTTSGALTPALWMGIITALLLLAILVPGMLCLVRLQTPRGLDPGAESTLTRHRKKVN
jgi:acyl dehydratase